MSSSQGGAIRRAPATEEISVSAGALNGETGGVSSNMAWKSLMDRIWSDFVSIYRIL